MNKNEHFIGVLCAIGRVQSLTLQSVTCRARPRSWPIVDLESLRFGLVRAKHETPHSELRML